jgi:hypothetical protein
MTLDQQAAIRTAFRRLRQGEDKAERFLQGLPTLITSATDEATEAARMRDLQTTVRGPRAWKRRYREFKTAYYAIRKARTLLAGVLSLATEQLRHLDSSLLGFDPVKEYMGVLTRLDDISEALCHWGANVRVSLMPAPDRGKPANVQEGALLDSIAGVFRAEGLPLTIAPGGLFLSVVAALRPGDGRGFGHARIRRVIEASGHPPLTLADLERVERILAKMTTLVTLMEVSRR